MGNLSWSKAGSPFCHIVRHQRPVTLRQSVSHVHFYVKCIHETSAWFIKAVLQKTEIISSHYPGASGVRWKMCESQRSDVSLQPGLEPPLLNSHQDPRVTCDVRIPLEVPGHQGRLTASRLWMKRLWIKTPHMWISLPEHGKPANTLFPMGQVPLGEWMGGQSLRVLKWRLGYK